MTTKPKPCWIYAIEINPELIPKLGRMAPKGTARFMYVGYTEGGPRERLAVLPTHVVNAADRRPVPERAVTSASIVGA